MTPEQRQRLLLLTSVPDDADAAAEAPLSAAQEQRLVELALRARGTAPRGELIDLAERRASRSALGAVRGRPRPVAAWLGRTLAAATLVAALVIMGWWSKERLSPAAPEWTLEAEGPTVRLGGETSALPVPLDGRLVYTLRLKRAARGVEAMVYCRYQKQALRPCAQQPRAAGASFHLSGTARELGLTQDGAWELVFVVAAPAHMPPVAEVDAEVRGAPVNRTGGYRVRVEEVAVGGRAGGAEDER